MVKKGPTVGGNGGSPFELLHGNTPVEQLDVWYGNGSHPTEQYTILRGIKVKWADDKPANSAGHCPSEDEERVLHTSFDFEHNGEDPLEWMDLYGSTSRADSLRLVDKKGYFEAGGIGGTKSIQPAKSKKLCGFYGRSGQDIDQLGAIFSD